MTESATHAIELYYSQWTLSLSLLQPLRNILIKFQKKRINKIICIHVFQHMRKLYSKTRTMCFTGVLAHLCIKHSYVKHSILPDRTAYTRRKSISYYEQICEYQNGNEMKATKENTGIFFFTIEHP